MLGYRVLIATMLASLCGLSCAPIAAIAQEQPANQWRFRFPDTQSEAIRVASRPSTTKFKQPDRIQVPSIEESRITIPVERSSKGERASDDATGEGSDSNSDDSASAQSSADGSFADAAFNPSDALSPSARLARMDLLGGAATDPYGVSQVGFFQHMNLFNRLGEAWRPWRHIQHVWVRPDYLYWNADGLGLPALVTSSPSGTPRQNAGVLGEAGTSVMYGQGTVVDDFQHGYRIVAGLGLGYGGRWEIEADYLQILNKHDDFYAQSDDSLDPTNIIARPFFDVVNGRQTAQLVSFADVASGSVSVRSESKLKSAGVYGRMSTCPCPGPCDIITIDSPLANQIGRYDVIVGYRYAGLKDSVAVDEGLRSLDTANPGYFRVHDSFATDNEFHGLDLGMSYHGNWRRFTTELVTKVAVGNMNQSVAISGYSDIVEAGFLERYHSGLLAQRSNIGIHKRNQLALLPQMNLNLSAHLTRCCTLRLGYSAFYMSNVVRAGDQIDTEINPNLFPPENPPLVESPLRPAFNFRQTDYWAHGFNVGADYRY